MTFFARIWDALRGDRKLMVASVVCGLLFTALGIIPPLLIGRMIRSLRGDEATDVFLQLGAIAAGVYLLRGGMRYLYGLFSHIAAYHTLHRMLIKVFGHLQTMPPGFLNDRHSGDLVARSVGDVQEIEDFIAHGIPETMLAVVIPISMSAVLFALNWQLALIALCPLPFVAAIAYVVRKRTLNRWSDVRGRFAKLSATMQDHLAGLATVQSFNAETSSSETMGAESLGYRDAIIRANAWSLVPAGIVESASGAGLVLLIFAGGWLVGASPVIEADVSVLVVFVMYLGQIFLPFLRLANLTEQLHKSAASGGRVFELLDTPPAIADSPHASAPMSINYEVEFADVDFAYHTGQPVLRDCSFTINAGETVALVGSTGAGKTTVCHLLLRFHDVTGGSILIGGHDIRDLPLAYLREQIGFVSQDVFLFQGAIRENLLLAKPDATEDDLHDAADAAHCLEFIESFPLGFDTVVGERGVRLSGGQKQRVAIVRALLKDAPILVLDEATSAVDAATESRIRDALQRAAIGRTVLIVAHRQSTIQAADRILVMEDGGIVESGTYEELIDADTTFARLCRTEENAVW